MGSVMVADPLRILDCSPITDGAAAVVLCPLDMARKISKKPLVKVLASAQASDTIALHSRRDLTWLESTAKAAEKAYKMAGKGPPGSACLSRSTTASRSPRSSCSRLWVWWSGARAARRPRAA